MSSVVACTDEFARRELERYGPWLALALADRLREEKVRQGALEQASVAPDRPREEGFVWARDERIELRRQARSRFTIHLGYHGYEVIRQEISWAASEGVEMGGFLWAHLRTDSGGGPVVIAHVSPPAQGSVHGRTSVRLGDPDDVARAWPDWLARSGMAAIGDVHSHPGGDGTPSRADLENWAWGVRQSGGYPWASLIAIRGEGGIGWLDPQFRGWVTTADGRGGFVCEPAEVAQP